MSNTLFHVNKWYFMKTVTSNTPLISALQIKALLKKEKRGKNKCIFQHKTAFILYVSCVIPELWRQPLWIIALPSCSQFSVRVDEEIRIRSKCMFIYYHVQRLGSPCCEILIHRRKFSNNKRSITTSWNATIPPKIPDT